MGLHSGHGIPQALEAWRIPFGGGMLAIRPLAPDIATDRMENPARLGLTMAGEPVELLAPGATLKLIVDRLEPLAQWDRLSPPACAAVLEYLLSDVLERGRNTDRRADCLDGRRPSGTPRTAWQFRF
ncbi:hypothetical protein ACOJBM_01130 [Rhizobium beringeri]